jgi:hypothetical protein
MKSGVKITKDNTKEFYKAVAELTTKRVYVGVPAAEGQRTDSPVNNATIGYAMEYGLPEQNVPARPTLLPGVSHVLSEITNLLKQAGTKVLGGDFDAVTRAFTRIGLVAQSAVRDQITNGQFAPLSERTLAGRRKRGNFSDKPLIDTESFRKSITYVVLDK